MTLERRTFLASGAVGLLGACATAPGTMSETPLAQRVRALIDAEATRQRLVGVQYVVRHRGETLAEGAFGLANLDSGTPVTLDTLFLIASITKLMTSTVACRLADRGVFDLSAPVQTYVPDFPTHPGGVATPLLLLNHSGGIRHYDRTRGEPTRDMLGTHYETATEALAVFQDTAYVYAPGTDSRYSSYGYALLAACMEGALHKPYTQIITEEIFTPTCMTKAAVPDMRYPIAGLAHSYAFYKLITGEPVQTVLRARENDYSYNPGGGNVIATARALAAFGEAVLRPGLLSEARWKSQIGDPWPFVPMPDGRTSVLDQASNPAGRLGWPFGHDHANRRFMHGSGASEAYQSGLTIYQDERLVICALCNTYGVGSRETGGFTLPLHVAIADAVLSIH